MRLFAIDSTITAFAAAEQIPEGQERFASEKELAKLAANWPGNRLVQIWNSFAGVAGFGGDLKPIKKFTNRKTGVARIWSAIQKLEAPVTRQAAEFAPKAKRSRKGATAENGAPAARDVSKKAIVLDMLKRPYGASLKEILAATEWQAPSVRGFISGSLGKKMGLTIESFKREDGDRAYRLTH